jgi:hypothetical protein
MRFKFADKRIARETSLEDLLLHVVDDYKLYGEFALEDLRRTWQDIVGPILVNHTKVDRIFKNTLFIIADHSIYAQEALMYKTSIIDKINGLYGKNSIKTVKVDIKKFT